MQYDAIAIIVIYYVTVILVLYSTISYKLLCLFIVVVVIHQYTIYLDISLTFFVATPAMVQKKPSDLTETPRT